MRHTKEDTAVNVCNYILLTLIAIVTIYPFYYTVVCSFNDGIDLMKGGVYLWPRKFSLASYEVFFRDNSWRDAFFVSVGRTVLGGSLTTFFTCFFCYGLSRKNLMGRNVYRFLVVFTMYFSGGLIPFYILLRNLNLLNSFAVYIIPGMLNTFFVLIGVNFFSSIPDAMLEVARIDGARELTIFLRIVMPVSVPFIATLALFSAVGQWNSWLDSAYYVRDTALNTLSYKMMTTINEVLATSTDMATAGQISEAKTTTSFTVQATSMVITMAPIMCVYPFLQKYFVQGMMIGAVKE